MPPGNIGAVVGARRARKRKEQQQARANREVITLDVTEDVTEYTQAPRANGTSDDTTQQRMARPERRPPPPGCCLIM